MGWEGREFTVLGRGMPELEPLREGEDDGEGEDTEEGADEGMGDVRPPPEVLRVARLSKLDRRKLLPRRFVPDFGAGCEL